MEISAHMVEGGGENVGFGKQKRGENISDFWPSSFCKC